MGLRDAVADPIAKIARPPVDTLPVIEPARPDRLGVLFGKKGRLQFGLAPLGPYVEQRIADRAGRLLRNEFGGAFDERGAQHRFFAILDLRERLLRMDIFMPGDVDKTVRSEEHTSELQSLMRISYAVFCLKKTTTKIIKTK